MSNAANIEKWIVEALSDLDKDAPCTGLTLMHIVGNANGHNGLELHSKKIVPNMNAGELAKLFFGKAKTYANGLTGQQTFSLRAFYGDRQDAQAYFPFYLVGVTELNGLATEAPNATGEKQQAMRWNEVAMSLAHRQTNVVMQMQERLIDQLGSRLSANMSELHDTQALVIDMIRDKMLDDQKFRLELQEKQRAADERKALLRLAPPLVNTITGREVFPQSTADTALIDKMAEHMTLEHVQMLGSFFPPEIVAILTQRVTAALEEKRLAKEAQESASLASTRDAEIG